MAAWAMLSVASLSVVTHFVTPVSDNFASAFFVPPLACQRPATIGSLPIAGASRLQRYHACIPAKGGSAETHTTDGFSLRTSLTISLASDVTEITAPHGQDTGLPLRQLSTARLSSEMSARQNRSEPSILLPCSFGTTGLPAQITAAAISEVKEAAALE